MHIGSSTAKRKDRIHHHSCKIFTLKAHRANCNQGPRAQCSGHQDLNESTQYIRLLIFKSLFYLSTDPSHLICLLKGQAQLSYKISCILDLATFSWWQINLFLLPQCSVSVGDKISSAKNEEWILMLSAWFICEKFTINLLSIIWHLLVMVALDHFTYSFQFCHSSEHIFWNSSIKSIFISSTIWLPWNRVCVEKAGSMFTFPPLLVFSIMSWCTSSPQWWLKRFCFLGF